MSCPDRLDRRAFLRTLGATGLALGLDGPASRVLAFAGDEATRLDGHPAEWGRDLGDQVVQCLLCPLECHLLPGEVCFCRNRANRDGKLVSLVADRIAVVEASTVEKGPLHHFLPGARALTLGAAGCNLRCLYCQNWPTAQRRPGDQDDRLPPDQAAAWGRRENCRVLGFNYTEPATTFEFTSSVAIKARAEGLRTYMASGLSIQSEPLARLLPLLDAVVGSLKGSDEDFYAKVVGGKLEPVQKALLQVKASGTWLEVAHLIVPTLNDSDEQIRTAARWVKQNLGAETPMHFARFFPAFRLENLPPTPAETMDRAWKIGKEEGLLYPYVSNFSPHPGNHTWCPGCGKAVIERLGVRITASRLAPGGACLGCGTRIHGVFA